MNGFNLFGGAQVRHGNGQIVGSAFFPDIGGSEIDHRPQPFVPVAAIT